MRKDASVNEVMVMGDDDDEMTGKRTGLLKEMAN